MEGAKSFEIATAFFERNSLSHDLGNGQTVADIVQQFLWVHALTLRPAQGERLLFHTVHGEPVEPWIIAN